MKNMKALIAAVLAAVLMISGCAGQNPPETPEEPETAGSSGDIVVLYTSDVHCSFEGTFGYPQLAGYRQYMLGKTDYVTLVDLGDFSEGGIVGSISKGKYLYEIIDMVGYDYAVIGNHDFGYGIDELSRNIENSDFTVLSANLEYKGKAENRLGDVMPYAIEEYGERKVAFIGVTTPQSFTQSVPALFAEDGERAWYFSEEKGPDAFYNKIQLMIDETREMGADYVILLTHLGSTESETPYSSPDVIANTCGADAILDGHSHSVITERTLKNKNGETVILSSVGSNFQYFGKLVISEGGVITTTLINETCEEVPEVSEYVNEIIASAGNDLGEVVGTIGYSMTLKDAAGIRMTRSRETAIGNFCADANRAVAGADIGIINGGGIRNDLSEGEISIMDLYDIKPFGNMFMVVEATGQEIIDALEIGARDTKAVYSEDGQAVGENGGFLQVSGLKYTIDTSVPSDIEFDEDGFAVSIGEGRRVRDVMIETADGGWTPIDPEKEYTVASSSYELASGGDGQTAFLTCPRVTPEEMVDYEVLVRYIRDILGGTVGDRYAGTEGRITVI